MTEDGRRNGKRNGLKAQSDYFISRLEALMSKKLLSIGLVLLIFLALFFAGIYIMQLRDIAERIEVKWYSSQLDYIFCANILDKTQLKQKWGYGYIECKIRDGVMINTDKEDSLQIHLRENKSVRFITDSNAGTIRLLIQNVNEHQKGDSLYVNCKKGQIIFYRKGKQMCKHGIASCLETDWFN